MGYRHFFPFVLIASIPSVIAARKPPFPDPPDVDEDEAVMSRQLAPRVTTPILPPRQRVGSLLNEARKERRGEPEFSACRPTGPKFTAILRKEKFGCTGE
jgi:hypothetical protein